MHSDSVALTLVLLKPLHAEFVNGNRLQRSQGAQKQKPRREAGVLESGSGGRI